MYQKTKSYRRELICAPVISDDEYIKMWEAVEYERKAFAEDGAEIITERGERVRAKSEKIIADKLYALGEGGSYFVQSNNWSGDLRL